MQIRRAGKSVEICILAGGLGSRMGGDKSKLRLFGRTLLTHIRQTAKTLNVPVRVIRRDLVSRCGPMGGIFTAFKTSSAEAILFLACDMPQVSAALLEKLWQRSTNGRASVFIWSKDGAGFPFVLNRDAFPIIEKLLMQKQLSLQVLAVKTCAKKFRPGREFKPDLLNVNTPADWIALKKIFAEIR